MNYAPLSSLAHVEVSDFLARYWQRQHLFARAALPHFRSPLDADTIAGFSLDEDVVSRLVIQDRQAQHWELRHGPLDADVFSQLPEHDWTLLIQHADALHAELRAILDAFRFIPNWRLDDIMVSYAAPGGGVGPHFDYYDVFLLQAQGRRRWRIGQHCDAETELLPDQAMKLLKNFDSSAEYICQPGDLLYVPAGLAHWGEALDDCITYSIGFRAPSHADIVLEFSQELASHMREDMRYRDAGNSFQKDTPGEIGTAVIDQLLAILRDKLDARDSLADWFGRYSTQLSDTATIFFPETEDAIPLNGSLSLSKSCRSAYFGNDANQVSLFVNGEKFHCSAALAQALCCYRDFNTDNLPEADQRCINALMDRGYLESGDTQ